MTDMRKKALLRHACQILLVLAFVVPMSAGCSAFDTTNNSNTDTGSCNAAGGHNSVHCSSAPNLKPSHSASSSPASNQNAASATPTATSSAVVIVTPSPKLPEFLSDDTAVDSTMGGFDSGSGVIKKVVYTDSIWGCFDTQTIQGTCTNYAAYEDYNIPAGYNYFQATAGFSSDSPSSCSAEVQLFGDGTKLFDHEIAFGDSIQVRFGVAKYLRLRFEIVPTAGYECNIGLGNAEFTS
jgi:hypothetical protein